MKPLSAAYGQVVAHYPHTATPPRYTHKERATEQSFPSREHGGGKERERQGASFSREEPRSPLSALAGLPTDAPSDLDVFHHD
eukprot:6283291-Prymnesium_polylepis.1